MLCLNKRGGGAMKMRVTLHNGRSGKDGSFRASHNDRDFDVGKADHINQEKSAGNWTWHLYRKSDPDLTFDQAERKFYETYFGKSLEAQNGRHRKAGNLNRVRTVDDYRAARQSCPEETILQIGKLGETVSPKVLHRIAVEQIAWEQKAFPNVKVLNAALHVDEEGAPHLHKRQVWTAEGKDGLTVSQNKALKEMGIERPDTSKPEGRYNNAKMSYTEQCREHFSGLCRKYGLDIEDKPKEASETGLSLLEYQSREEQKKLDALKAQQDAFNAQRDSFDLERRKWAQKAPERARTQKAIDAWNGSAREREKVLRAIEHWDKTAPEREAITVMLTNRKREQDERNRELDQREAELLKREKRAALNERSLEDKAYFAVAGNYEKLKAAEEKGAEEFRDAVESISKDISGLSL